MSSDNIEELLNQLSPEYINELPIEEVNELRKKLNPYGRIIEGSDKVLTFSYTNLHEKYLEKFLITTFIGFLNRMCDEWHVPDDVPITPVYEYVQNPNVLQEYMDDIPNLSENYKKHLKDNMEWMKKRVIVKQFLEEMFQFDPDEHVRSAYKPNFNDETRKNVNTPSGILATKHRAVKDEEFSEELLHHERKQKINGGGEEDPILEEVNRVLAEKPIKDNNMEDETLPSTTYNIIPPINTFYNFNNYKERNYNRLRDIVNNLYCEKPDLELAICPHSWHNNVDEADNYIDKHKNEVISEVYKATSGKWTLLAPWEESRQSMRYFNEKTIILEEIFKQREEEAKWGRDVMKKRVKKKKKENIKEFGPESEQFKKWRAQNKDLQKYNMEELSDDDTPEDLLEIPVIRISKGGSKVEQTKFYIPPEQPDLPPN